MRCHYLSDLHLETQEFRGSLPKGDVLIIAGDLCHARCLDPSLADKYSVDQRGRVMRFIGTALGNFKHVLLVMGNHDHYHGVFDATADLFRKHTRHGLNPRHAGNGLDGVYASDLDEAIWEGVHNWVHGHTHMGRTYRVGNTFFRTNCRGFDGKDACARKFSASTCFDLGA